jgi:hypothetical protein
VNEGIPIILSRPQSFAASSFHELATAFIDTPNGEAIAASPAAETKQRRSLFRLRRN